MKQTKFKQGTEQKRGCTEGPRIKARLQEGVSSVAVSWQECVHIIKRSRKVEKAEAKRFWSSDEKGVEKERDKC